MVILKYKQKNFFHQKEENVTFLIIILLN